MPRSLLSLLLTIVALPLLAACSSGGGGAVGGSGGGATTTTPMMDAGVLLDAAPDALVDAPLDAPADAPVDATPDAEPDAAACALVKPYSSQDVDCNACAEASCCAEVNACLLDADCDDGYVNCAIVCALEATDAGTEPACLDDCAQQYPKGAMEYDAAIGCVHTACMTECQ